MERVQGAKSGITFGNAAAGAGSSGDGTLLNAGSVDGGADFLGGRREENYSSTRT